MVLFGGQEMNLKIELNRNPLVKISEVPIGHFFKHPGGSIGFVGSEYSDNKKTPVPTWFYDEYNITGWKCSNLDLMVEDLGKAKITLED